MIGEFLENITAATTVHFLVPPSLSTFIWKLLLMNCLTMLMSNVNLGETMKFSSVILSGIVFRFY